MTCCSRPGWPSRSIVFGKLVASVAFVLLVALTALPGFAMAWMFGGVGVVDVVLTTVLLLASVCLFAVDRRLLLGARADLGGRGAVRLRAGLPARHGDVRDLPRRRVQPDGGHGPPDPGAQSVADAVGVAGAAERPGGPGLADHLPPDHRRHGPAGSVRAARPALPALGAHAGALPGADAACSSARAASRSIRATACASSAGHAQSSVGGPDGDQIHDARCPARALGVGARRAARAADADRAGGQAPGDRDLGGPADPGSGWCSTPSGWPARVSSRTSCRPPCCRRFRWRWRRSGRWCWSSGGRTRCASPR